MQTIRCRCGKIICQVANMPEPLHVEEPQHTVQGPAAVILCRHCKRYVVLQVPTITSVSFAADLQETGDRPLVSL